MKKEMEVVFCVKRSMRHQLSSRLTSTYLTEMSPELSCDCFTLTDFDRPSIGNIAFVADHEDGTESQTHHTDLLQQLEQRMKAVPVAHVIHDHDAVGPILDQGPQIALSLPTKDMSVPIWRQKF